MESTTKRLTALDILRGFTIIFMIIVNDPGSWSHVYAPLLHADWNGITPTDYIFPTFIFIMGTSMVLSLGKLKAQEISNSNLFKKVAWRALKIYLVGLFLWLWPDFDFGHIRWVGVLHRIAIVYFIAAILFIFTRYQTQLYIAIGILVGYLLIMCYLPVPGIGAPDLSVPEKNWAHYIDSLLLPGVLWEDTWDPEGLLSTFPAVVTCLLGMFAGYIIKSEKSLFERLVHLAMMGFVLLFLGDVTQFIFPLNKNIWSTSFTLLVGGISTLAFTFFIFICDHRGLGHKFKFAQAFGVNSIFSYAMAGMLTLIFYSSTLWGVGLSTLFMEGTTAMGVAPKLASLLYAMLYVGIIWIPTYLLFKRKIYIKL